VSASLYIAAGAAAFLAAIGLALLVRIARVRHVKRLQARVTSEHGVAQDWMPPETPAPFEQLVDASLESRIAAWVAGTTHDSVRTRVQAADEVIEPISGDHVTQHSVAPGLDCVAPVEIWFGNAHVTVSADSPACHEFVRIANLLLGDLPAARARDR